MIATVSVERIYCYPATQATLVVVAKAGECSSCHAARYNFVNRDGRSLCWACDREQASSTGGGNDTK